MERDSTIEYMDCCQEWYRERHYFIMGFLALYVQLMFPPTTRDLSCIKAPIWGLPNIRRFRDVDPK